MTLTRHNAANGYGRDRAESKLLSSKHPGNDHVTGGFQPTVSLNENSISKVVSYEHVLGFCKTNFPGYACVFY